MTQIVTDISVYTPWVARKNAAQSVTINFVNSTGAAFNITPYTLKVEIWRFGASSALITGTTVNGGTSGILTASFTAAQLNIAASKDYFWILRESNGTVWFNGLFTLNSATWNGSPTSSITATIDIGGSSITATITLGGSGGGHVIQDNGTSKTQRTKLNFIGFTVADDAGNDSTDITAPTSASTNVDGVTVGGDGTVGNPLKQIFTPKILPAGDYTLLLSDASKELISDSASAINIIIPPFSSVAWQPNTAIAIYQRGAGQVTITYNTPITLHASNSVSNALPSQYSSALLELFEAQDVWQLSNGTAAGGASDATITMSDIATNNASTSKHGFMPKLTNSATTYFDSQGNQTVPPGAATDVNISTSDVTNNNVSTSKHGFTPKAPNDVQQVLIGDGTWSAFRLLQNAIGTSNDRYITGAINGTSPNTAAAVANTLRAYPIIIPYKTTIDKIIMEVTTGTSGKIRFGIYSANSVGYPNSLIVDAGEVTITTPAVISVSSLSAVCVPGMYFLTYLTDTANTFRSHQLAALNPLMGTSISMGVVVGIGWTVALAYTSLPSTFTAGGTVMTTGTPVIGVRMT